MQRINIGNALFMIGILLIVFSFIYQIIIMDKISLLIKIILIILIQIVSISYYILFNFENFKPIIEKMFIK